MNDKDYTEDRIQQECVEWFWNTYPQYRGLLCYNDNNAANAIKGAINKRIGMVKGRSDLSFYYRFDGIVFIEMKTPDGVQSPDQKEWQKLVESRGFKYVILRSVGEFQNFIKWFMNEVERGNV